MFKVKHFALALAALPLASAASAATVDLVANFGGTGFSYGSGNYSAATPGFTPFTHTYSNCFDIPGLNCVTSGPSGSTAGSSNLPGVGSGEGALHFITVDVPAATLWAHPGNSAATDAVVRYTASAAGIYTLSGLFERLDNMTSGSNDAGNNGVDAGIFATIGGVTSQIFTAADLTGYGVTQFTTSAYSDLSVALGAGDFLSYVVSYNGNYYNDSTGLKGTISFAPTIDDDATPAVPEPASWAMMLAGFGFIGFSLRSRRTASVTFA